MQKTNFNLVQDFHRKFLVPTNDLASNVEDSILQLRISLITEEFKELIDEMNWLANSQESLSRVAKEMADLLYVIYGTADQMGINIDKVFEEVHQSNMSKSLDARRDDGKVLKGEHYRPADVKSVLQFADDVL